MFILSEQTSGTFFAGKKIWHELYFVILGLCLLANGERFRQTKMALLHPVSKIKTINFLLSPGLINAWCFYSIFFVLILISSYYACITLNYFQPLTGFLYCLAYSLIAVSLKNTICKKYAYHWILLIILLLVGLITILVNGWSDMGNYILLISPVSIGSSRLYDKLVPLAFYGLLPLTVLLLIFNLRFILSEIKRYYTLLR
ncbi:MAG: hypothetical protein PHV59_05890 [Victivallales bacterium]|nr:hypothetical protein [Victivallales bacterium]